MKLVTNKLLLISAIIITLVFIAATFRDNLGLERRHAFMLALAMMIAFGINVAGLIFGLAERRKDRKKAIIGIVGNSLLLLFFVLMSGYALMTTK